MSLKKYCRCGRLIDAAEVCCEECKPKLEKRRLATQREYNRYKRQDADFYGSEMWKSVRATVMARYSYLDLYEYFINNNVVTAEVVHHIEEFKDNKELGTDMNNLIPLSNKSHRKIHKMYRNKQKQQAIKEELKKILLKAERVFI